MRKTTALLLLKMAGAAQAIEAFHHYHYGVPFTLMCDHKPLERLGMVHKRTLLRLQELMGQYNFVIEYLPGKMNELANVLSRTANVCAVSLLSGEDDVVKEQSRQGIIDGVVAAKWVEEQQKDAFCQAAWALCRKKNKSAAENGASGTLRDRQKRALSRSGAWERSEIFWRRSASDNAVQNSQNSPCFIFCGTQRGADHVTATKGAVLLAWHGNRR